MTLNVRPSFAMRCSRRSGYDNALLILPSNKSFDRGWTTPPKTARTPKASASTTLPANTIINVSRLSLTVVGVLLAMARPPFFHLVIARNSESVGISASALTPRLAVPYSFEYRISVKSYFRNFEVMIAVGIDALHALEVDLALEQKQATGLPTILWMPVKLRQKARYYDEM